jgi:hypothetical protein
MHARGTEKGQACPLLSPPQTFGKNKSKLKKGQIPHIDTKNFNYFKMGHHLFCGATIYSLVDSYQSILWMNLLPELWYAPTKLHGITPQKSVVFHNSKVQSSGFNVM